MHDDSKLKAISMILRQAASFIAFAAIAVFASPASAQEMAPATAAPAAAESAQADLPSPEVTKITGWVLGSRDNGERPFIIIDKNTAEMFAFDAGGHLVGRAPVLIGIAKGDQSTPGVGDRELSRIRVEQRTTPAGRFFAKFGPAAGHKQVLWIDYADSVSLHAVISANKKERRLQRLNSRTADDNRITFGCINAPTAFYKDVVQPLFKESGVVYILPDSRSLGEVFPAVLAAQPAQPEDSSAFGG